MKKLLIILCLCFSSLAFSEEFHILKLDEVKVDYISFFKSGRDPLITQNGLPNRELGKLLDVNINTTLLKYGYWRSLVHSYTDAYSDTHLPGQFRLVGLNMELGLRVSPYLDIYAWHYSQHLLDYTYQVGGFPVQDGVGIHLYLYRSDSKSSILGDLFQ